jgi:signal transduction histidine kinase
MNLVTRTFLVAVLGFTLLGGAGDARPAARRARRRVAGEQPAPSTARDRARHALAVASAFADEVGPGRTRARQAAVAERSRIARELHAEVVPAIRHALVEAERDGSPERLAVGLRAVLGEVDALVASRHSVVLEVGGLVPAIEWLAERTEDRSDVRVTIDVAESGSDGAARPPASVAGAAYRVAELALDNVVRHAPRSYARIDIVAEPDLVSLAIADDGPGLRADAERGAAAAGRRGLADMRAEASAVDASLRISTRDGAAGTLVRFRWPAD